MKEQFKYGEFLFLMGYILYATADIIQVTHLFSFLPNLSIWEVVKILGVMFVLMKIIMNGTYSRKYIVISTLIFFVSLIASLNNKDFQIFYVICLILGMKDISYIKVLKIAFFTQLTVLLLVFSGIIIGYVPNEAVGTVIWSNTMINDGATERYDLGFIHPNVVSAVVFFTTLSYMCLKEKCRLIELLISILINYMVYQKTGSRTCFLMIIVFLPLMYLFANKKRFQQYWKNLFTISPIFVVLTAVFAHLFYDPNNELYVELSNMLSSRLRLGYEGFMKYGISLFGQETMWLTTPNEYGLPYSYIDCAYMRILLDKGIVLFLIFLFFSVITMHRLACNGQKKYCVAFLAVLVHSMIEQSIYDISLESFVLLMGTLGNLNNKEIKYAK